MTELWCHRVEREAAERLTAELAKPDEGEEGLQDHGVCFDPWSLFPAVYGTYGGEFDACAIQVLMELERQNAGDWSGARSDLGARMFREMLCTAHFCDYGTSPRACFWSHRYADLLPQLRERWQAFSLRCWGEQVW